jgi:hypothetical protein
MAGIEDKIAALETKLKQAKVQKQQIEARKRAVKSKAKRLKDTRRKILIGAFVLEQTEKSGNNVALFTLEGKRFDEWVKRSDERELFKMAPKMDKPQTLVPEAKRPIKRLDLDSLDNSLSGK